MVRNLKPGGVAILNNDDTKVRMLQALGPPSVVTYGLSNEANVWIADVTRSAQGLAGQLNVRTNDQGKTTQWKCETRLVGRHQLSAVAAAFAVAYTVGVPPETALAKLKEFSPPPGRLTVLPGKGSLAIIDDSYNASPQAMLDSLAVLQESTAPRTAVLGEMRELGPATDSGHRSVGEYVAPWLETLVTVGEQAQLISQAAVEAGMSASQIHHVDAASQAAAYVPDHGTVLVKGSRGVGLEAVVGALLRDPRDRARLVGHGGAAEATKPVH